MPRAKLQVARARATKRHCMIILFDAIIASPDLAATPLHAIRGDFSPSFFLFFLFFFFGSPAVMGRSIRAKRDYSYFDAIGLLC